MPGDNATDSWSHFASVIRPEQFDISYWLQAFDHEFVFYRVDQDHRITFVTPSVENVLGYPPAELLGRDSRRLFDLEHPAKLELQDLSDLAGSGVDERLQRCVARRRDGEIRYLLLREREYFSDDGVLLGREGMVQDDTARVQAELGLRQSELQYQSLVEGVRGDYIIYTHAPDGTVTYVSPSIEDVLGYDPRSVVGMNWRDLVQEDNFGREAAERVEQEVEQGKQFHELVVEIRHIDGTPKLLEVQQRPTFSADGAYLSMEGIAKDITEATQTQDELRALRDELEYRVIERTKKLMMTNDQLRDSESRYRDLVEKQAEFIVRWGPDGRRRDVNEAYCRYLGRPREQLIGGQTLPVIVEEDIENLQRAMASLSPEHPSVTYEHRVRRSDGAVRWTQWTDTAFYDEAGRPTEYLSVGRDVTELKRAEDRLREKQSHLAHVSRLATMGELVAGIAHEVHQPLHAARTFAEAARRHLESARETSVETAIECSKEIVDAIGRTATIIRRLRDFTKGHPGQLELLELNSVVREAVEIMAFSIRRDRVVLQLDLDDDLPSVQGDRIQLQQVCVNLIQNACEASVGVPDQQRRLLIRTYAMDAGVSISFRDFGKGVDETTVRKMFDAFFTTKADGMGMGLSLCQSIAEAHGARIEALTKEPEPGMEFMMTFPRAERRS